MTLFKWLKRKKKKKAPVSKLNAYSISIPNEASVVIRAKTMSEARKIVRENLGLTRLPVGTLSTRVGKEK